MIQLNPHIYKSSKKLVLVLSLIFSVVTTGFSSDSLSTAHFSFKPTYQPAPLFHPFSISATQASQTKKKKTWFEGIRFSGNARFVGFYRNLEKYYEADPTVTNGLTLPVNLTAGDGTQQPLLLIAMEGNPSRSSMFKFEMNFDHLLLRTTNRTNQEGRIAQLFLMSQFQAGVDTRLGRLDLTAGGGVNWYRLSPLTFWGYQFRDDFFERYPWEPDVHDWDRYNSFYQRGEIARDARFGMQATQGVILHGSRLPKDFDVALIYGKNTQTGGFNSFLYQDPQRMFATRIGKMFNKHQIGYNFFSQGGNTENRTTYEAIIQEEDTFYVESNYTSTIVTTLDSRLKFKNFDLYTEVGMGSYLSPIYHEGLRDNATPGESGASRYKRAWDESVFTEITTSKNLTGVPITMNVYRIGTNVVNNLSNVQNTSVETAISSPRGTQAYNGNYKDGVVTEAGQLANNRQGMNLNTFFELRKLKVKPSLAFAQEIVNLAGDTRNGARGEFMGVAAGDSLSRVPFTNSITFHERLNAVSRARFIFNRRFAGPYNRIDPGFRRTFENITITDTVVDYKKSFSNLELEMKYKTRLFRKDLILTNFINASTVQEKWSPIPAWSDESFLRYFYEELMAFYALNEKYTLVGFTGFEMAKGNNRTELADAEGNLITDANGRPVADPDGKPLDQRGIGYGIGIDWNFETHGSLHLRSRWYQHKDNNFTQDEFKGHEITFEFKKFF